MKCPHCGKNISDKLIAKHLASKGGSKSRRVLTPEQAREMVVVREKMRKSVVEMKKLREEIKKIDK